MEKKIPVIILARAGSKGIKNKNIIDFCGKPLLAWSIMQAINSTLISNVYVSTDGENIADIARSYGAAIIRRPQELATDISSSEDALIHALDFIEKIEEFDSVVFLQPTSPIRRKKDIDDAVTAYRTGQYDSLFSMAVLEDYCIWSGKDDKLKSISYDYNNRGRRQDREAMYLENGSIYVFSKDMFKKQNNRLCGRIGMYEMPLACSYEIDTVKDIEICEYFMKKLVM